MRRVFSVPQAVCWPKRLGVLLVLELAWFALLYPLVPSTFNGLVAEFAAGLVVFGLVYGGFRAIFRLHGQPMNRILSTGASLVIVFGVGIAIPALEVWFRAFVASNFDWFLFR